MITPTPAQSTFGGVPADTVCGRDEVAIPSRIDTSGPRDRQLRFLAEDGPQMTPSAAVALARIVRTLRDRQELRAV